MRSSHHATNAHEFRILQDARLQFLEVRGLAEYAARQADVDALPHVVFKGRHLRTLRCHGTRGKGPHDCNVPESLLWALMDLRTFCCVFHHGDQLPPGVPV